MANWGWRPSLLHVFLCVLVVACSDTSPNLPSAPTTNLPPVTLTVRISTEAPPTHINLPILITPSHNSPQFPTFTPPAPVAWISTRPLELDTPTCYEMPHDGIACLGWVNNPYNHALERVMLRVDVFGVDASLLDSLSVTLPQHVIPPGGWAPYQALFAGVGLSASQFGGVEVDVIRAEPNLDTFDGVVVDELQGAWVDSLYQVTGKIRNDGERQLTDLRVVITVYDDEQGVMGFRIVEIPLLDIGEIYVLSLDMMPQVQHLTFSHSLHIEQATLATPNR
jgi:hypothetical protein